MKGLGMHYLAELYDCSSEVINDLDRIDEIMTEAANISKATIVKKVFHKFSPYGISGIVVVAESHFAIHTWPEHCYAAVDLFSCGDFDYRLALEYITTELKTSCFSCDEIERGILPGKNRNIIPLKLKVLDFSGN